MKYQPQFPKRFGCIEDAKTFCRHFFDWYNRDHHHVGIGLMTPDQVHYGQADEVHAARQQILDRAFRPIPNASSKRRPSPQKANSRMDQSAGPGGAKQGANQSLNSNSGCLTFVAALRLKPSLKQVWPIQFTATGEKFASLSKSI